MRRKLSKIAVVAGVAASIGIAGPAAAQTAPVCVGTQQTAGVCAWLQRTTVYQDCVYLGSGSCTPVYVGGYDLECSGWIYPNWVLVCS